MKAVVTKKMATKANISFFFILNVCFLLPALSRRATATNSGKNNVRVAWFLLRKGV